MHIHTYTQRYMTRNSSSSIVIIINNNNTIIIRPSLAVNNDSNITTDVNTFMCYELCDYIRVVLCADRITHTSRHRAVSTRENHSYKFFFAHQWHRFARNISLVVGVFFCSAYQFICFCANKCYFLPCENSKFAKKKLIKNQTSNKFGKLQDKLKHLSPN